MYAKIDIHFDYKCNKGHFILKNIYIFTIRLVYLFHFTHKQTI